MRWRGSPVKYTEQVQVRVLTLQTNIFYVYFSDPPHRKSVWCIGIAPISKNVMNFTLRGDIKACLKACPGTVARKQGPQSNLSASSVFADENQDIPKYQKVDLISNERLENNFDLNFELTQFFAFSFF